MSEAATPKRLNKIAVEFNVSISTVVDFLSSKGIEVENKPTAKISEEAYEELLKKFSPDKLVKQKAEEKRQLTPLISKQDKVAPEKRVAEPEAAKSAVAAKQDLTPVHQAPKAEEPEASQPEVEPEVVEEKSVPVVQPEPVVETKAPEEEPEVPQFKVVGKIDLNEFKRKKSAPAKEAPAPKPEPVAEKPVVEKPAPEPEPQKEEVQETVVENEPEKELDIVERTVALLTETEEAISEEDEEEDDEEIESSAEETKPEAPEEKKGLTIVGKIDLDQFKPKKKPLASTDDLSTIKKKRRKRKPIGGSDKPAPQQGQQGGQGSHGGERRDFTKVTKDRVQNTFQRPSAGPGDNKEMDEKRIQEQIKSTLNKLTKKANFSDAKNKIKKKKKEERRQRQAEQEMVTEGNVLQVTEFITANELANMMNLPVTQVITACMSLGLMVSINQRLDAETITLVADEFGYEVQFKDAEMDEPTLEDPDNEDKMIARPPIVTIMGHVDHGKTSLLDYIRNTNVVAGESGGITQHIGAYEVMLPNKKKITFLDTPGHEAFTAMRARGAKITDIAIIVIAADDQVMPQTREAISHAQAAGVPIVFAFNKIDKEGANTQRIREQLAEMNMLVEEWGGKYQTQEISAKKGLNVDQLLEKVLLEAEILDLKADPTKRAVGTVIEASLDRGKGIVANILVEKGTLRVGDPILAGSNYGRVKALFNERGGKVTVAGPATPVQVLGFDGAPTAGDRFYVPESESMAKDIATKRRQLIREQGIRTRKHITLDEIGRRLAIGNFKELNLIIKGDVDGSVEALSDSLQKLSTEEVQVNVIFKGVGQISESDVLLASASDAIIIGFQVRPSPSARKLAENEQIDIRLYSVIYNAIEEVKTAMEGLLTPTQEEKIVCNIEIREVFRISKVGAIAGCYVLEGKIARNTRIRVVRDGVVVYTGELDTLKRFKDDVKEVSAGYECGLNIKNFNDIKVGDIIEGFEQIEVARKL